jgi:CTP synthase
VNPKYVEDLTAAGLLFTGKDDTGTRMEIVELPRDVHPFFFATQFHPEFLSRPVRGG